MTALTTGFMLLAAVGLLLGALQAFTTYRHLKSRPSSASCSRGISILKPLCGADDGLEQSLEQFAALDYPRFELLLGVRDRSDSAYPVARRLAERHPGRVRVLVQRGEPGLNPKVNQLLTLSQAARFDLLVISDSNVRVPAGYLSEIAAELADDQVGLVTHPVSGICEETPGAVMDNLYLAGTITPGVVTSARLLNQPIVVGKSMALRREVLEAIGGFGAFRNVLAEDYLIGWAVHRLGKRVVLARLPVANVSQKKSVSSFYQRFVRWSTMQHKAVGTLQYGVIALQNPIPWAGLAVLATPSTETLRILGLTVLLRGLLEFATLWNLRGRLVPWSSLWVLPVKDVLVFVAWCEGMVSQHVSWRGTRLRVGTGTRLSPATRPAFHGTIGPRAAKPHPVPLLLVRDR